MSAAGRCDSRASSPLGRGRKCRLPRFAVGLPVRPVVVEIMPVVLRGCVRAALRAPRATRGVRRPGGDAGAVRDPRSASGSPGARASRCSADAKPGSQPAAWSAASTAASRPRPDGISRRAMPRPGTGPGPRVAHTYVPALADAQHSGLVELDPAAVDEHAQGGRRDVDDPALRSRPTACARNVSVLLHAGADPDGDDVGAAAAAFLRTRSSCRPRRRWAGR